MVDRRAIMHKNLISWRSSYSIMKFAEDQNSASYGNRSYF